MPKRTCCLKLKEIIREIKRFPKGPKFLKDKDQNRQGIFAWCVIFAPFVQRMKNSDYVESILTLTLITK
jgi:hypothetical protein